MADSGAPARPAGRRRRRRTLRSGPRRELAAFMAMALLGLVLVSAGTALFTARVARANAVADAELSASRLSQYLVAPILADALAGVPGRFDELQRRIEN